MVSAVALLMVVGTAATAQFENGGKDSQYQSKARPFGLDIVDTVKASGTDEPSADFNKNYLAQLRKLGNLNLPEGKPLSDKTVGLRKLDPNKIKLFTDAQVRLYFIGEGAGYHNTLGFNSNGAGGIDKENSKLIFPDASSSVPGMLTDSIDSKPSINEPLTPGDFVNMGSFAEGTQLQFFLGSNAVNGGSNVFTTKHKDNPDGLVHAVAYALPDSPYLLIGFEDLWKGGDRDYNDLMFTIDIGKINVEHLSSPEPGAFVTMGIFLGIVGIIARRNPSLYRSRKQQVN